MVRFKKFISIFSIIMTLTFMFSTITYAAEIYTPKTLPYEYETVVREEQPLDSETKEVILQNLLAAEYPGSKPSDIVIRYYGKLNNGAMLINHFGLMDLKSAFEYESAREEIYFYMFPDFSKDEPPVILGDADGDGNITVSDAAIIMKAGIGLENISFEAGDVNDDERISVLDATCVQKYLAGYTTGTGYAGYNELNIEK